MKNQSIIPGAVKSGKRASGFSLNKFVKKLLESMGFAATTDCCTYFPTAPRIYADDPTNPNVQDLANVPDYVLVACVSRTDSEHVVLG